MVLEPIFLGNATEQCQSWFIQLGHIHRWVLSLSTPISIWDGLPREHRLVDVDDPVPLFLGLLQLPQQLLFLPLDFVLRLVVLLLLPCDLALLYSVHPVDLAEQGIVHHTTRKLLLEVPDSVLEREARLLLQCLCVNDPIDFM